MAWQNDKMSLKKEKKLKHEDYKHIWKNTNKKKNYNLNLKAKQIK